MSEDGFLQQPGFATKAIHVGQEPEQWNSNAVIPPITLSTTFKQEAPAKHKVCTAVTDTVSLIDCNSISHNCKCEIGDAHSGVAECKSFGMSPVFLSE
jgi:hypothetical protein